MLCTEFLAFRLKPASLQNERTQKVGARLPYGKTGIACVSFVGSCRTLDEHDVAVPFFIAPQQGFDCCLGLVMNIFERVKHATDFQLCVAETLNLDLIHLTEDYPDYAKNIICTFNYTKADKSKYSNSPKPASFQRRLQNSFLFDIKEITNHRGLLIDIAAGGKRYGEFLGIKKENNFVMNLYHGTGIDFVEDAEGPCSSVPCKHFDTALCLNYLLLAKEPCKVVENVSKFLKPGGIAILDFAGLTYWYLGSDGRHWHSYNPSSISDILNNNFSESVIVPVGNWLQATLNYYTKRITNRYLEYFFRKFLLKQIGNLLGKFDHDPTSAIHYFVVAKK